MLLFMTQNSSTLSGVSVEGKLFSELHVGPLTGFLVAHLQAQIESTSIWGYICVLRKPESTGLSTEMATILDLQIHE